MNEQKDKCVHHDDLKQAVGNLSEMTYMYVKAQSGFEAKVDSLAEVLKQVHEGQRDLKRCVNEVKVDLAKNYVTKQEFTDYCDTSEDRIKEIHSRLNEIGQYQRDSLWRIILYFAPIAALIFTVITWVFGKVG